MYILIYFQITSYTVSCVLKNDSFCAGLQSATIYSKTWVVLTLIARGLNWYLELITGFCEVSVLNILWYLYHVSL